MGSITVRLAKRHIDCHDSYIGFSLLMRVALMSAFNLANSNTKILQRVVVMLVKMGDLVRRNEKWGFYSYFR